MDEDNVTTANKTLVDCDAANTSRASWACASLRPVALKVGETRTIDMRLFVFNESLPIKSYKPLLGCSATKTHDGCVKLNGAETCYCDTDG